MPQRTDFREGHPALPCARIPGPVKAGNTKPRATTGTDDQDPQAERANQSEEGDAHGVEQIVDRYPYSVAADRRRSGIWLRAGFDDAAAASSAELV